MQRYHIKKTITTTTAEEWKLIKYSFRSCPHPDADLSQLQHHQNNEEKQSNTQQDMLSGKVSRRTQFKS